MKIGGAKPDTVERHGGIPVRLAEVMKSLRVVLTESPIPFVPGVKRVLIHRQEPCVRVESPRISANFVKRHHRPDTLSSSRAIIARFILFDFAGAKRWLRIAMTRPAVLFIDRFAPVCQLTIDRIGVF